MKDGEDLTDLLVQKLRWLRLPGMAKHVATLLDRAAKDNLTTLDVIHRLCDEEKQSRLRSAVDRRLRDARFPEINTVDGFDFDFDTGRKKMRSRYLALHDLAFLDKGINHSLSVCQVPEKHFSHARSHIKLASPRAASSS